MLNSKKFKECPIFNLILLLLAKCLKIYIFSPAFRDQKKICTYKIELILQNVLKFSLLYIAVE